MADRQQVAWTGELTGTVMVVQGSDARGAAAIAAFQAIWESAAQLSACAAQSRSANTTDASLSPEDILAALVKLINEHEFLVVSSSPLIRGTLQHLGASVSNLDSKINKLTATINKLQQDVEILKRDGQKKKRNLLLGQVAYKLDVITAQQVFRGESYPAGITLKQIQQAASTDELTELQLKRWQQLVMFLKARSWTVMGVVTAASNMRRGRGDDAHGSLAEQRAVTKKQLLEWAEQCSAEEVPDAKRLIDLVSEFTHDNVLSDLINVASVVDKAVSV